MTGKQNSEDLRLRAEPGPVTRLSRPALAVLAGIGGLGLFGAAFWALQPPKAKEPGQELYSTDVRPGAEGLAALPSGYTGLKSDVPRLGSPLPGDLGRPLLRAQRDGMMAAPASGTSDPEALKRLQEADQAVRSRVFFQTAARVERTMPAPAAGMDSPDTALPEGDPEFRQNMQARKEAFLTVPADRDTLSSHRLQQPVSPDQLMAGTIIAAALLTGIKSDLPGLVEAQVTEHVYDSVSGRRCLVPQGSRLIGRYDSQIAFGQSRVLLVWTRLIRPDGSSIVLDRLPASDEAGYAGVEDGIDYHWDRIFAAAAVSTLLDVGMEMGADSQGSLVRALRDGTQDTLNQAGQQIVRRQLNVQPTLTVRPGWPLRVLVAKDIVLPPMRGGEGPCRS
ncbi:MAG: TrbI/VirB10 family protein [Bacteroidota bacterium]